MSHKWHELQNSHTRAVILSHLRSKFARERKNSRIHEPFVIAVVSTTDAYSSTDEDELAVLGSRFGPAQGQRLASDLAPCGEFSLADTKRR
jgi:hypothetical protein